MPKFIPGVKLSRLFYQKEVRPILNQEFSKLRYSAALIGWGSEVLSFDTALSRDHHWGPRVLLFLSEKDFPKLNLRITHALSEKLPYRFMGYSTNFSTPDPVGVRHQVEIDSGPVAHMVNVYTVKSFFELRLGLDPSKKITPADWLTLPQQRLLELVSGEVYHDDLGELEKYRSKLKFYPTDVWLYLLASQWTRISQEEAFVGRAGETGDELGSQLVASSLVREIMKLAFLMEREYAPYSKWFGRAFSKLKIANKLSPLVRQVLLATTWQEREKRLAESYSVVAKKFNSLRITRPLPTKASQYYDRPYIVIHGDHFAEEIKKAIKDPQVKRIKTKVGSIDQFTDSTDVTQDLALVRRLRLVYEETSE